MGVFTTRRLVWFAIFWMGYVHAINRESTFATGRLEPLEVDRADNQTGVAFAADLGGITSSDIGLGESQSRRIVTDDAVLLQGEMTFNRAVKKRVGEAVPPVDVATWRVVAEDLAEKRFGGNTSRAKGLRTLLAEAGGGAKDSMVDWQRLAYLLAGLRPLELLPKQLGPSYAFPTQHVAGHRSLDWPRVNQDAMIRQKPAFESYASFEAAWNEWTLLCIIGLCLIMLTSIITSTRRSQQPARTTLLLELETRWRLTGSGTAGSLALLRAAAKVSEEVPQSAGCSQEELSVWDGTVALFSTVIGTGLLAMPYAFSLAGMAAIPMTIFFVGCSAYTAHLMVWTMEAEASRQRLPSGCWRLREVAVDWGSLANAAFGKRAKYAVEAFLIVELWSYLLSSVVCAAMNVAQLFEQLDVNSSICICVVAAYGLTFVPAKTLTKVNVLSNFIFLLCCVMFLVTGLMLPTKAPAAEIQTLKPRGILAAAGILVYNPAGHSFYPRLVEQMEEPSKFPSCIKRAYGAACVAYLAVAVPGYCLFGNAAQPSLVRNIGADLHMIPLPDLGWMNTAAALGIVLKLLPTQTLVLSPLAAVIKGVISDKLGTDAYVVQKAVTPTVLLVSAIAASHFANEMAVLLSLVGSVFCMIIAFVMPVLCYWRLAPEPLSLMQRLVCIGLVSMGVSFSVLGVISSL